MNKRPAQATSFQQQLDNLTAMLMDKDEKEEEKEKERKEAQELEELERAEERRHKEEMRQLDNCLLCLPVCYPK